MHALIICEDARFAELLTVALRQVGLRGVVRRTPPADGTQLVQVAVVLFDGVTRENTLPALSSLRTLTTAPIMLLSPPAEEETFLELYHRGATSVLEMPCDLRVLAAQALALARLVPVANGAPEVHPLLDPDTQSITLPNGSYRLTTLEYRLLAALLSRPGRVFAPEALVEHVWGYSGEGDRGLVKGLVNRVRRKIEPAPQKPEYLLTEAGVGYRFLPPLDGG